MPPVVIAAPRVIPDTSPFDGTADEALEQLTSVTSSDLTGFLGKIREKQLVLKKTETFSREERKKSGEPEEVSAILMRRAAMEESDSDQGFL